MRHNFMHFIGIVIFFFASLVLFGQHASNNGLPFKEVKKESLSQPVKNWYLFENLEIAESSSSLVVREDDTWHPERLPNDHLRTVFSYNGRFFAHVTINPRESTDPIDRELTVTVYNSEKKILFILQRQHLFDRALPQLILSEKDGSLILGESDTGKLWFYDNRGSVIKQVTLFTEASYDLERILIIKVSEDGARIAVLATKRGSAPAGSNAINPDADPHLFLFDSKGEELWRIELPEYSASALNISPDGTKILVNNYTVGQSGIITRKSLIYNDDAEVIFETDLLYKFAHFSSDSRQVILADNQTVRLIDLENNKLKWQRKISRKDGMVSQVFTVETSDMSAVLLGKNDWNGEYFVFHHPGILISDGKGTMLQEITFEDQVFRTPALWISPQGDRLKIGFENSFYIYSSK